MKKVLLVHYSQSGQLNEAAKYFVASLESADDITVSYESISPVEDYPFPWPFWRFFDTFPEAVYLDPPAMAPLVTDPSDDFDLIILAYQVWFLSPALPMTGFLQSKAAAELLKDKPVVTLIACRNMWLQAQEQMKLMLSGLGARLVGNVALVDAVGSVGSFLATPVWVLTGNKGPQWGGLIPRAGVSDNDLAQCSRFGERIREVLQADADINEDLLAGLAAVNVDEKLIASEKVGRRSFKVWGGLLRAVGPQGSWRRKPVLAVYIVFLVTLILTFVPLSMLVKKLLSPLFSAQTKAQKHYFSRPSGEC